MTFEELCDKVRRGERFSFSRWGDGEWACLLDKRPGKANCDGHTYFSDLGQRLHAILASRPNYHIGLQPLAKRMYGDEIDAFGLSWSNADILHKASMHGELHTFFDAVRRQKKRVIVVGPSHLDGMRKHIGKYALLEIPERNCWLDYERVARRLTKALDRHDSLVLFAASMMSNVLIHDFHGDATLIDIGSVFDPYCGVKSRTYMRAL